MRVYVCVHEDGCIRVCVCVHEDGCICVCVCVSMKMGVCACACPQGWVNMQEGESLPPGHPEPARASAHSSSAALVWSLCH